MLKEVKNQAIQVPINSVTVLEEKNGFFPANSQLPSFGAIS